MCLKMESIPNYCYTEKQTGIMMINHWIQDTHTHHFFQTKPLMIISSTIVETGDFNEIGCPSDGMMVRVISCSGATSSGRNRRCAGRSFG